MVEIRQKGVSFFSTLGPSDMQEKFYWWKTAEYKFDRRNGKNQKYVKIVSWIWLEDQLFYMSETSYYRYET